MYIVIFIIGILVGSFLNVCIYRMPREGSIVFPSSHCPHCSHPLLWYDLIPILSFVMLKGRCRYCKGVISPLYPTIEFINGIIYIIIFYFYGLSLEFVFYSLLISALLTITLIDLKHKIIPDGILLSIFIITILYKSTNYLLFHIPISLMDSLLGFLLGGGLFFLLAIISKGGMGGGDIKLISVLGLILGLKKTLLNILLSFIIGAFISLILLCFKKKGRKDVIAFGPFINLAFIISLFFGDKIICYYINSIL